MGAEVEQVKYELSLKDLLTGKLHEANEAAQGLEGTIKSIGVALGIGFGIYEAIGFIKESAEEFHKLREAQGQIEAGLKSTGYQAGLTAKDLEESANALRQHSLTSMSEMTHMQAVLLTFPAITKKNFNQAEQSILDLSTRLRLDPSQAAIQVGKALQDPLRGMVALHREGVNFSEQQKQQVKDFMAHGKQYEAQMIILKELQTEFAGSAEAAFNTDPMARANIAVEQFKLTIGELVEKIKVHLAPMLEATANWFTKHIDLLKYVGYGFAIAGAAMIAYNGYLLVMSIRAGIATAATFLQMVATDGLSAALYAAGITGAAAWALMTGGLSLLVVGLYEFYNLVRDTTKQVDELGNKISFFDRVGKMTAAQQEWLIFKDEVLEVGYAIQWVFDKLSNKGGYAANDLAQINALRKETSKISWIKEHPGVGTAGPAGATGKPGTTATNITPEKAKGSQSITINIHMDSMVKQFTIQTTKLEQSAHKAKEFVENVFLDAINNASIQANI